MVTDPLFYRIFKTSPETLFLVLGMSAEAAQQRAAQYEYDAIEFKETSHRVDGIFRPKKPGLPLYVLEVQFYDLPSVYAGLLAKAYTYLKQHDPAQPFVGIVLFADRKFEPDDLTPYKPLIEAGIIRPFYLEEMPEIVDAPLGLSILYLIRQAEAQAPMKARELIARTKTEIGDESLRADLIELVETIVIYKLPHLSREEIQAMLQVDDIRQTRVFQEAKEEGLKEGKEEGLKEGKEEGLKEGKEEGLKEGISQGTAQERERSLQEKLRSVAKLAALKMPVEQIAEILGLNIELVRREITGRNGSPAST